MKNYDNSAVMPTANATTRPICEITEQIDINLTNTIEYLDQIISQLWGEGKPMEEHVVNCQHDKLLMLMAKSGHILNQVSTIRDRV